MDRRKFLKDSARATLAIGGMAIVPAVQVGIAGTQNTRNGSKQFPVIDTHLHCFAGEGDARFPYHERAPYRPKEAATPEYLLECMNGAGIEYGVVVTPEPYQDDHRYLEHCLDIGGDRLKGTCLFFADRPGSVEKMAGLVRRRPDQIKAARIHAYAPDRLPPFGKPELRSLWKTAADLGLSLQLHFEPRYAPEFESFIREFPDTTVIIDHLGRPFHGLPEEHAIVIAWSRYPNTVMKFAGIPAQTSYPHRDIKPVIRQLTDAYGADRIICGGGFNASATPESYRQYYDGITEMISYLSDDEIKMILGGTAARVFDFDLA